MLPNKEREEILNLDTINPDSSTYIYKKIRAINKEKRLNIYHIVVHILAFIIVIPYLVMIIFQINVPTEYFTIVAIIIGFYFARSLFD